MIIGSLQDLGVDVSKISDAISAFELLTPTGAAILAHFVHRSEPFSPQMSIEETGYGAGSRDLPMPNVFLKSEHRRNREILAVVKHRCCGSTGNQC